VHLHLTSVLGVLGTQETFCIVIAGLLERDSFDLFIPEFDKPWVIHLRETCCCSTNLCTWWPNTVYKNRRVRRHQSRSPKMRWRGARGQAHPRVARPAPGLCHQGVRPAGPPPDASLLPIYSPQREKPKGRIAFPRNILQAAAVVIARLGGSRSSSRHPAGEGNPCRRPSPPPWSPLE
jgi:hypothetical protein